jgi:hypothetical protein
MFQIASLRVCELPSCHDISSNFETRKLGNSETRKLGNSELGNSQEDEVNEVNKVHVAKAKEHGQGRSRGS